MPRFRATNLETQEVTEYDADTPEVEHTGEGWRLEAITEAYSAPDAVEEAQLVYGGRRILTKLEFLRLFTVTERITMRQAAKQDAVMEDYLQLLDLAQEISLDDPDTIAGLQMMEAVGLLAAGRAAEVLRG